MRQGKEGFRGGDRSHLEKKEGKSSYSRRDEAEAEENCMKNEDE